MKNQIPLNLAHEIGVSVPHLCKVKNGTRLASWELTKRAVTVCRAHGIPLTTQDLRPDLIQQAHDIMKFIQENES